MLTGIHHTSITVSDTARSHAFYREVLGFDLVWDSEALGLKFEGPLADTVTQCPGTSQRLTFMRLGSRLLEFVQYTPAGKAQHDNQMSDTGAAHVGLRASDIDSLYRRLIEHGARVHCSPQDVLDMRLFYFRDPDGVGLEAMQGRLIGASPSDRDDAIHHTSFTVSDMDRSLGFYRDLLGLRTIFDTDDEGMRMEGPVADAVTGCPDTSQRLVYLAAGTDLLELVEYRPTGRTLLDRKASDTGTCHVCFLTDDIEGLHARLRESEVVLHCVPQEIGETTVFYYRDPDGIVLEAMGGTPVV